MLKAPEILTNSFWMWFVASLEAGGYVTASEFVNDNVEGIVAYGRVNYNDLLCLDFLDEMTDANRANIAYVSVGAAWARIFDVLTMEYDPMENYYTDRVMSTDGSASLERKGKEDITQTGKDVTTPSGTINVATNGTRNVTLTDTGNVGQGTTYDSATTTPTSTTDFYNISKVINNRNETESFTNHGTTTSYTNYKVEHSFENRKSEKSFTDRIDESESNEDVEEHRRGSSGIFAKQDLAQREINLRLKNRVIPILVRMVVDVFNSGVWDNDD